jgi:adenylosuccinate synthase
MSLAHKVHMVIDLQFGSTGKGLLAGYMAKREDYDTVVCSFATNAGHTYIDKARGLNVMTQQLPTGITSPTVQNVLIGPGALICPKTFRDEVNQYAWQIHNKRIMIHPHAAVVYSHHALHERTGGMSKIGSTTKGVGEAMIQRIRRDPEDMNIAANDNTLKPFVVSQEEYADALNASASLLVEGAQGFGLSMYHGFYPYTTSRDVTPWQIAADCGLPYNMAPYIQIFGTLRTFPIRVNNRDGWSGPHYPDQRELEWAELGIKPELTTVTKLPRRIFTFSQKQLTDALFHCGGYWKTNLFLNFANYIKDPMELATLVNEIERPRHRALNPPMVTHLGFGPDDSDVKTRDEWVTAVDSEGGEL